MLVDFYVGYKNARAWFSINGLFTLCFMTIN